MKNLNLIFLKQSGKDLAELNDKAEDLKVLYSNHESTYDDLLQKCKLAEEKAVSMTQTSLNWKLKFEQSQQGLIAFEMAQVYENIADDLMKAHDNSVSVLQNYSRAEQELEEMEERSNQLKEKSSEMAEIANEQIKKIQKLDSDYKELNSKYVNLDHEANTLAKELENIDLWINKTLISDQILSNLETELNEQEIDLKKNEEKSLELIRRVESLDTLKGSISGEGNDDLPSGQQLIKSIEKSIDNLRVSSPNLTQSVQELLEENDFNQQLDKITKDIYDLKILIDSTRQMVNDIEVAVKFNDSSVINLRPPVDLHPSMTTTSSLYVKTQETNAPLMLIYNASNPNEYLAMYLQEGRPHVQYKLSSYDSEPVVLSTEQQINNDQWHKIEIDRTAKLAKLKVYSEDNYQEASKRSIEDSSVFNLDHSGARIILGQFPVSQIPNDLRQISASNNQFRGAMDKVKLNNYNLGIWNHLLARNIKGELNRKFIASDDKENEIEKSQIEKGVFFLDESFMCKANKARLKFSGRNKPQLDVTLRFKTVSANGLLWLWYKDDRDYYAIYLQNGHINVVFANGAENKLRLFDYSPSSTSYKLNDNNYHTIKVIFRIFLNFICKIR